MLLERSQVRGCQGLCVCWLPKELCVDSQERSLPVSVVMYLSAWHASPRQALSA